MYFMRRCLKPRIRGKRFYADWLAIDIDTSYPSIICIQNTVFQKLGVNNEDGAG